MTAILISSFSWTAVASSCIVICMLPSPVMTHTSLSGLAIFTPMAAGIEKPMVPIPPEVMKVFGSLNQYSWAAHIWCWPTSATTIASPFVSS